MRTIPYIIFAAVLFILNGCTATHVGMFTGSTVMIPAEHRYAGSVSGKASAFYFLGIGGLQRQGLAVEARANMLSKFPMRDGLILTNVTTDIKTSYVFCFIKRTLILSADVIDIKQLSLPHGLQHGYFLNDTVFFMLPTLQTMISNRLLLKGNITAEDYQRSYSDSWAIGDTYPIVTIGKRTIMGKIVDFDYKYGILMKAETGDKPLYVYVNPQILFEH